MLDGALETSFEAASYGLSVVHAKTGIGGAAGTPGDAILMFHAVGEDLSAGYFGNVSPEQFRARIAYLREHAKVVPLSDLQEPAPERQVAITFDDGLKSVYTEAFPILKAQGVPATVFVNPAFVDDRNREVALSRHGISDDDRLMLTDAELHELAESSLVTIGNHTLSHRDLSTLDDPDALRAEVVGSKELLESRYGIDADLFSYPHGARDERSRAVVEASHRLSVTTDPFLTPADGSHRLPRLPAHEPPRAFRWEFSPAGDKLNRFRVFLSRGSFPGRESFLGRG